MSYVLKLNYNTQAWQGEVYTLTTDGSQTRTNPPFKSNPGPVPLPDLDMDHFWCSLGSTLNDIVADKVEGWDQIRILYQATSQPIFDFVVTTRDGDTRSFGIYGRPYLGAKLEAGSTLPQMYVDLFQFVAGKTDI